MPWRIKGSLDLEPNLEDYCLSIDDSNREDRYGDFCTVLVNKRYKKDLYLYPHDRVTIAIGNIQGYYDYASVEIEEPGEEDFSGSIISKSGWGLFEIGDDVVFAERHIFSVNSRPYYMGFRHLSSIGYSECWGLSHIEKEIARVYEQCLKNTAN